ncbi:hypothetical protein ANACOL_03225 [Anaerotruncus colihominis DSM 17241]|uniref:Uncharacterized protein n=1 Tax=Anaerotruncus colihominis DSM 17241 TaxID=445972 RepID=B0PEJ7_9FIRM|nr:hypothetical protein ANACOL_03225 [Anaerotruncus colihominis DSM 17241]
MSNSVQAASARNFNSIFLGLGLLLVICVLILPLLAGTRNAFR